MKVPMIIIMGMQWMGFGETEDYWLMGMEQVIFGLGDN